MEQTLYLIPAPLGDTKHGAFLNDHYKQVISKLTYFITENVRTSRRYLKKEIPGIVIDGLEFRVLDKRTGQEFISGLLQPILAGKDAGLISEAGLPCIADPGSILVRAAHEKGIRIVPIPGPSSIFLALEASGFNGQQFEFHGYLPIDKKQLRHKIRELETEAYAAGKTHIFMETPYRNNQMFDELLKSCKSGTSLCIAADLTLNSEYIKTMTIEKWAKEKPDLHKRPAVFLISV